MEQLNKKAPKFWVLIVVRLAGIEPAHLAPEASALSTELQAHIICFILVTVIYYKHI